MKYPQILFSKQLDDISKGGKKIFYEKIKNIFLYPIEYFLTLLFLPIFLLIRLISKFLLIRFGYLTTARIGHFAVDTHIYLENKSHREKNIIDLIYYDKRWVCNKDLLSLFKRHIFFYPKILIKPFLNLNKIKILGNDIHEVYFNNISSSRDTRTLDKIENNKDFCEFNLKQIDTGKKYLQKHGVNYKKDKFVCILGRDQGYMEKYDPIGNYDHHSYRNCSIKNLELVSEYLASKNYYVFRMGKDVKEKFNPSFKNKMIIDYANSDDRSEFLDIFLLKNCEFCISTDTGLYGLGVIFNKPILFFSIASIAALSYSNPKHFFIFKKYYSKINERYLTLSEIFEMKLSCLDLTKQYDENNIQLIENNSLEILEATKEIIIAINSDFKNLNMIENQKFWKIFDKNIINTKWKNWHINKKHSYICNSFLKKNEFFLK